MRARSLPEQLGMRRTLGSSDSSEPKTSASVVRTVDVPELDDREALQVVAAALEHGERSGLRVDLLFVDDPTLRDLHEQFLDDPTLTDVMAFDYSQADEAALDPEAEVYVSVDRARAVALERGDQVRDELLLYIAHGCLHLCGFDDRTDEDRDEMRAAERVVLASLS
jgi:probable rRNA maturation factor